MKIFIWWLDDRSKLDETRKVLTEQLNPELDNLREAKELKFNAWSKSLNFQQFSINTRKLLFSKSEISSFYFNEVNSIDFDLSGIWADSTIKIMGFYGFQFLNFFSSISTFRWVEFGRTDFKNSYLMGITFEYCRFSYVKFINIDADSFGVFFKSCIFYKCSDRLFDFSYQECFFSDDVEIGSFDTEKDKNYYYDNTTKKYIRA